MRPVEHSKNHVKQWLEKERTRLATLLGTLPSERLANAIAALSGVDKALVATLLNREGAQ